MSDHKPDPRPTFMGFDLDLYARGAGRAVSLKMFRDIEDALTRQVRALLSENPVPGQVSEKAGTVRVLFTLTRLGDSGLELGSLVLPPCYWCGLPQPSRYETVQHAEIVRWLAGAGTDKG